MTDNDNKLTIKELRQKYKSEGYESLTNEEKIRLLISYSEKGKNIDNVTESIMSAYGNIHIAADADVMSLINSYNIGTSSVALLKLIPVLSRLCTLNRYSDIQLNSSENAKNFFYSFLQNNNVEKAVITALSKNFRIKKQYVTSGDTDKVDIPFSKVYEFAKSCNASYIFLAHCHPDGDTTPSDADIHTTIKIKDALSLIDVPLVDHIIVGTDSVLSMREYLDKDIFDSIPEYRTEITKDE